VVLTTEGGDAALLRAQQTLARAGAIGLATAWYQRPLDLLGGGILFVLFLPFGAVIAALIKFVSPGPILFRQERVGKDGQTFTVYKFRTMRVDADQRVHQEYFERYRQGIVAPDQDGDIYKLRRDPRLIRGAGSLRRLGLDELPQIINVLKGDMSLVGPRPPLPYEVDLYDERDYLRLTVKPGMTGLWQIRGRDVVTYRTMIDLDLEYVERQSLRLDLAILLLTVPTLVWSSIKS